MYLIFKIISLIVSILFANFLLPGIILNIVSNTDTYGCFLMESSYKSYWISKRFCESLSLMPESIVYIGLPLSILGICLLLRTKNYEERPQVAYMKSIQII